MYVKREMETGNEDNSFEALCNDGKKGNVMIAGR